MSITIMITVSSVMSQIFSGTSNRCTYHHYESFVPAEIYDNSPGWCGIRYSSLDLTRVTAVNGMNEGGCNQCLEVTAEGGNTIYVLAIDFKADPGLDISETSFHHMFPDGNPLDPITCSWNVVDPCYCTDICTGSPEECTIGLRNLLPAYLMPPNNF